MPLHHSLTRAKSDLTIRFIVFRFLSLCLALFRYVSLRFVTFLLRTLEQVRTRSNILTKALKNIN